MQWGTNDKGRMHSKLNKQYRHEYKYYLDACQSAVLESRCSLLLPRDSHAGSCGSYQIKSLYFDDWDNSCYYENEDGVDERSKFRIRYYNQNLEYISLEKKSKKRGMTQKQSCRITREMCEELMHGNMPEITADMPDVMQQLLTQLRLRRLMPRVIVLYELYPYIYSAGNVRVTFDKNIRSSNDIENFLSTDISSRSILPVGQSILEVKWDEILPEFIKNHLMLDSLQWTSFSKYYLCRKINCQGGILL